MPYKTIRQLDIYYELQGKGPPLLLIAGYSCDLSFWAGIREMLAEHFSLLLFDNYGVGRSGCPKGPLTIEQMATDVLSLIDVLQIDRPHILGHSMGGAIAQEIAKQNPSKIGKAILAQTFLKLSPASVSTARALLHLYGEGVSFRRRAEVMMPWLFSDAFLDNSTFCESFLNNLEQNPYKSSLEGLKKQSEALIGFDSHSWCSQIKASTLVLGGEEDRLCPPSQSRLLSEKIPNAKLHLFKGAGHLAPVEQGAAFCKAIADFCL